MSILIKGMEMPKEGSWKTIRIYPDGTCAVPNWQGDCTLIKDAKAIPVPPHGRMIDADALRDDFAAPNEENGGWRNPDEALVHKTGVWAAIDAAPTIIEAEEGE